MNTTNTTVGDIPTDGLYSVNDAYKYTTVDPKTNNRDYNPNGIDDSSLNLLSLGSTFEPSIGAWDSKNKKRTITYDFSNPNINAPIEINGGFFVAYSPFCANDVIGGGTTTVPEPATMVIFGLSMLGIIGFRKKA